MRPDPPDGDSIRKIALDFLNYPVISTITSFEKDNRDFPKFIRNVTKIDPQSGGSPLDMRKDSFLNFLKNRDPGKMLPDEPVFLSGDLLIHRHGSWS
jgi:hypothetical protein